MTINHCEGAGRQLPYVPRPADADLYLFVCVSKRGLELICLKKKIDFVDALQLHFVVCVLGLQKKEKLLFSGTVQVQVECINVSQLGQSLGHKWAVTSI